MFPLQAGENGHRRSLRLAGRRVGEARPQDLAQQLTGEMGEHQADSLAQQKAPTRQWGY